MLKTEQVEYRDGDTLLEAYVSWDPQHQDKKPAVLIAPDWSGKNHFSCDKADKLAKLGYVGFALDMYGKGVVGNTKEEKSALIQPFMQNRHLLLQRMLAAFETVKHLP